LMLTAPQRRQVNLILWVRRGELVLWVSYTGWADCSSRQHSRGHSRE
jgi:hypothetical protein